MVFKFVLYFIFVIKVAGVHGLAGPVSRTRLGNQVLTSHSDYLKNNFKSRNKQSSAPPGGGLCGYGRCLKPLAYVSTTLRGINLGHKFEDPEAPENVMIVDGTGLAYRCFFALPDLKTARGTDIGCLMGFMNSLSRLYRMFSPKYIGVVFDSPGANDQKRDIWPEYKLNRQVVSSSFRCQLGWIREFCAILGLPVFIERSTEADDIITSMINFFREASSANARRPCDDRRLREVAFPRNTTRGIFDKYAQGPAAGPEGAPAGGADAPPLSAPGAEAPAPANLGYDVTVVTADKDLLQILSQNGQSKVTVKIVQPHKSWRVVNQHTVRQEYGIDPERFSEYLALVGDQADNIPGIMGVGPKTAPKLIAKYQTFDVGAPHPQDILGSEEITKLAGKGGKYSDSVRLAHEFHAIVKLKKDLRVLSSMEQLVKSSALSCQLSSFLRMFSLQKAASKWSMFTKA